MQGSDQHALSGVIAVDGPAASGKGTIAKALARHFGFWHLDTGALYRGVALALLKSGGGAENISAAVAAAQALDPASLDDPALRTAEVGAMASRIAAIPQVRAALFDFQRAFAARPPGAVLDGRDIATVICPDAAVKLFVTASPEERARRRHRELAGMGLTTKVEAILEDLRERDLRDTTRTDAPLVRAADADLLDTTELSIEAAVAAAIVLASDKLSAGPG